MGTQLWSDSQHENVQCLINWLLSQRKDSGWGMDWPNWIAFAELSASALPDDLDQSMIMKIVNQMVNEGKRSVADFERIFMDVKQKKEESLKRRISEWRFFIPLEMTLGSGCPKSPRVKILGKSFAFLGLSSVKRRLGKAEIKGFFSSDYIEAETGVAVTDIAKVFLSVTAREATWQRAWKEIAPAFDALRGMLEFTHGFGGWRLSFGSSRMKPRRKVPHPPWMIAKKPKSSTELVHFLTDVSRPQKAFQLTDKLFAALRRNVAFLSREPKHNSIESLITDCLRLYSQAMDARFNYGCLLGLWQLAEAITRAHAFGGDTDKVVSRLAWHGRRIGSVGSGYRETLHALSRKRNEIVHRGIHEVEDEEINVLKLACEVGLVWLIQQRKSLPTTAHLDQYYRLREANTTELSALRDCVKYIQRSRTV